MRRVHGAIGRFRESRGRLPAGLSEVCDSIPEACQLTRIAEWAKDAWGRPLVYTETAIDYELHSAGGDAKFNTDDDLVLSSAAERAAAARVAGCYSANLSWWKPLEIRRFVLDTVPDGFGAYGVTPAGPKHAAYWLPITGDSLMVAWSDGVSGLTARLRVVGDSLSGIAGTFTDMSLLPKPSRPVSAHRVPCLD